MPLFSPPLPLCDFLSSHFQFQHSKTRVCGASVDLVASQGLLPTFCHVLIIFNDLLDADFKLAFALLEDLILLGADLEP